MAKKRSAPPARPEQPQTAQPEKVTLAPFAEGSLTEFERHHLRLLRTLSDEGRTIVRHFAEEFLHTTSERKYREATAPRPISALRLVVDNDLQSNQ